MTFPTPDDLAGAPLWENYILAQATTASLGLVPRNAVALGVTVDGSKVGLRCQLSEVSEADVEDLEEIADELDILVGGHIEIDWSYEVLPRPKISPFDGVRWIYAGR